jgi:DNA-binding transcriptional regulator YhcF (GntR family)
LEFKNNIPIYLQVIDDIKHKIVLGELNLGDKLPSTRELAVMYQINPNTAVRVYNEMELMGLCFTKQMIFRIFASINKSNRIQT